MTGRFSVVSGGLAVVFMVVGGAIARAGDTGGGWDTGAKDTGYLGCGDNCPVIEVESFEEYDELLLGLEKDPAVLDPWPGLPDLGVIPQLWEGLTSVMAAEDGGEVDRGNVFTRYVDGQGWQEAWVVHQPDVTMRRPQRLPFLGKGALAEGIAEVQELPNADEYGILTFDFNYRCPPNVAWFSSLPTDVPRFVTHVFRFKVFLTEPGQPEVEAGALYRERMDIPAGITWQDTWVLWDNFGAPGTDPAQAVGREVRLEASSWGGETVRAFLEQQMYTLPGRCVVRTHSQVEPVP